MVRKLVVSHAGSQGVFSLVEPDLLKQLLAHQTEWVYGHKSYRVNIDIVSHPFEVAITTTEDELNKQPMLHVFWTDAETEAYRNHVKDQLTDWLDKLQKHNCNNYLIVHATFQDKHAILHKFSVTKTSMTERVRSDFGSHRADRTVAFKAESNGISSSQSWLITVGKIRDTILKSVTLKLSGYEKSVNQIRDTHEDENFDLYKYLGAKEQLCALYELTGLYEEAYRSSEEVLSLFRQYVANLRHCQIVPWLEEFIECEITDWSGLHLGASTLLPQQVNSLQLSSLIFGRIAHQLIMLQKPRDLAGKGLQFLLAVVKESQLLKTKYPEGAMKVWIYIGCIELLGAVKKSSPNSLNNMDVPEPLAVAKAQLYNLAREKLLQLGGLAGHLEGDGESLSKEQIDVLITGSKPNKSPGFPRQSGNVSADVALILTDKAFFHKQYIDLCQLSIVSFKLGSWTHHAQQILLKQAVYLRGRGVHAECLNAETHLRDVCHAYYTQGWHQLAAYSRIALCDTQRYLGLVDRELTTCCHLSTELEHTTSEQRVRYSTRLVECIRLLDTPGDQLLVPFTPLFQYEIYSEDNVESLLMGTDVIRVKNTLTVKLRLFNSCTETITRAVTSLKLDTAQETLNKSRASYISDSNDFSMVPIENTSEIIEDGLYGISLKAESELVNDENENSEGVKQILLVSEPAELVPGPNDVILTTEINKCGTFGVSSIQVQAGSVIFRLKCPPMPEWLEEVQIETEASSVKVAVVPPPSGVLISCRKQFCILAVSTDKAFHSLNISLKTLSKGLKLIPVEEGSYSVENGEDGMFSLTETGESWTLTLPAVMADNTVEIHVPVISEESGSCDQHHLDVAWPGGSLSLLLTFYLPFIVTSSLQFHDNVQYLISEISSNVPADITLTSCELENPGSLSPVLAFQSCRLIPQQKMSHIWSMDRESGTFPTGSQIKLGYGLSKSDDLYEYITMVTAVPQEPTFSISIKCTTKSPKVGDLVQFRVTIETTQTDKRFWRLLYGVTVQSSHWVVSGSQRRQIDVADKISFPVDLLALNSGTLEFPKILLWEFREAQLQTIGNSRDMLYINQSEEHHEGLTPLSPVEHDPLGAESAPAGRIRSTSTLPRAEKIDYFGGKVKAVNTIVLTTLTRDSIQLLGGHRVCAYNSLSVVVVGKS